MSNWLESLERHTRLFQNIYNQQLTLYSKIGITICLKYNRIPLFQNGGSFFEEKGSNTVVNEAPYRGYGSSGKFWAAMHYNMMQTHCFQS